MKNNWLAYIGVPLIFTLVCTFMAFSAVTAKFVTTYQNWDYWNARNIVAQSYSWQTTANSEVIGVSTERIDGEFLYAEIGFSPTNLSSVTTCQIEIENWRDNTLIGGIRNAVNPADLIIAATDSVPFVSGPLNVVMNIYCIGGATGTIDIYSRKIDEAQ